MDYLKLLIDGYSETKENLNPDLTPLEYLSDYIFGITTYDGTASERMGKSALLVCLAISERRTFDYITDVDNYIDYLNCVNFKFFSDKLCWGTSIRGAWWDIFGDKEFELKTCGLWKDGEQVLSLRFKENDWNSFIYAMRDFVKSECGEI